MDPLAAAELRKPEPVFDFLAFIGIVLGVGAILALAKDVLIPLALATLLSFALSPVARALQRIGLPRGLSAIGAGLVAFALIGLIFYIAYDQASGLAGKLPEAESIIKSKIDAFAKGFGDNGPFTRAVKFVTDIVSQARGPAQPAGQQPVVVQNQGSSFGDWAALAGPVQRRRSMEKSET